MGAGIEKLNPLIDAAAWAVVVAIPAGLLGLVLLAWWTARHYPTFHP